MAGIYGISKRRISNIINKRENVGAVLLLRLCAYDNNINPKYLMISHGEIESSKPEGSQQYVMHLEERIKDLVEM